MAASWRYDYHIEGIEAMIDGFDIYPRSFTGTLCVDQIKNRLVFPSCDDIMAMIDAKIGSIVTRLPLERIAIDTWRQEDPKRGTRFIVTKIDELVEKLHSLSLGAFSVVSIYWGYPTLVISMVDNPVYNTTNINLEFIERIVELGILEQ